MLCTCENCGPRVRSHRILTPLPSSPGPAGGFIGKIISFPIVLSKKIERVVGRFCACMCTSTALQHVDLCARTCVAGCALVRFFCSCSESASHCHIVLSPSSSRSECGIIGKRALLATFSAQKIGTSQEQNCTRVFFEHTNAAFAAAALTDTFCFSPHISAAKSAGPRCCGAKDSWHQRTHVHARQDGGGQMKTRVVAR